MGVANRSALDVSQSVPWFQTVWDRFVASDPGRVRLRMAISGVVSMLSTIGIELLVARLLGLSGKKAVVFPMLGGFTAMLGTMAMFGMARDVVARLRTVAVFPVAFGIGITLGVIFREPRALTLAVFVVVTFVAVWVRRFGSSFFIYGYMGWMGYLFASLLHASFAHMPVMLLALAIAAAWLGLLSITILRVNPTGVLVNSLRAFYARARALTGVCAELATVRPGDDAALQRWRSRLDRQQRILTQTALMIEASSGQHDAVPNAAFGKRLRAHALELELAVDGLGDDISTIVGYAPDHSARAAEVARLIGAGEFSAARTVAQQLREQISDDGTAHEANWAAYRLVEAVGEYERAAADASELAGTGARAMKRTMVRASPDPGDSERHFEPAVDLTKGALPGSATIAKRVVPRGPRWLRERLSMTTRQALQVAVASTVAILVGLAVSDYRYYWALIAVFMTFSGTTTRAESARKAIYRVVGTLAGLVAAIGLAHLTGGHGPWVLVVIGVSIFCGMYLNRISYAFMIFFMTIMLGQLYSVMGEFSDQLLVLRLVETAVGAGVAIVVSLVFLPLSTQDTVLAARRQVLDTLGDALGTVARRLDGAVASAGAAAGDTVGEASAAVVAELGERGQPAGTGTVGAAAAGAATAGAATAGVRDLDLIARQLDDAIRQLTEVATPFARPSMWGDSGRQVRFRLTRYTAIATEVRQITVALHGSGAFHDPVLAEMARSLAEAAGHLASEVPDDGSSSADDLGSRLAERLSTEGEPENDQVARSLLRIDRLLREIASQSGAVPA